MKFEVNSEDLLKHILIADSVISSKNVNTILSNCLFNVQKDFIQIISTDNEIGIKTFFKVRSDTNFSFIVNGKRFAGILKELPKTTVTVTLEENYSVNIKTNNIKGSYSLVGMPRGDFPDLPDYEEKDLIEIDQHRFREMIKKVSYSAALDSIRPAFCGVYFLSEENGSLTAVATDSKRLSLSTVKTGGDFGVEEGVIVPLKTINEVSKLLTNEGKCGIYLGKNRCYFEIGDTKVISRIVDGQFPNYKQVIPKEYKTRVIINKTSLLEALRRIMVFTREPSYKILLSFQKDVMRIEAKSRDLGEGEEELSIISDGDEKVIIGICGHYLLDAVKAIENDELNISITSSISPIKITADGKTLDIAVIMPIQIRSDQEE